jgi:hypothetical protein
LHLHQLFDLYVWLRDDFDFGLHANAATIERVADRSDLDSIAYVVVPIRVFPAAAQFLPRRNSGAHQELFRSVRWRRQRVWAARGTV